MKLSTGKPSTIHFRTFATPDGEFFIAFEDDALLETGWTALRASLPDVWCADKRLAPELVERIQSSAAGEPVDFTDVVLPEASEFFAKCRRAVQRVPAGTTVSYVELARLAGSHAASRAAGQAMRRNPTPIVVPCHRVISATGSLGGFAGASDPRGGAACAETDLKSRLLERERGYLRQSA
ncbi:MAG: methylated-DNA--[protein]-cysteine S-methyltransferase [Phycisphaerae bacterium]|nr:methylated-DNA--[protein]-cysteine S-methyltransferase [Phycisphaerae bacterium]